MPKIIPTILIAIVVGAAAFFGGMQYAKSTGGGGRGNFANLTPEQRAARVQQFGGGRGGARGANFTAGQVIAKDDKSITLKLMDGGSAIVFFTPTTPVMKAVSGTTQDVSVGQFVSTSGNKNQDGSINADSIQIRPTPPPSQAATSTGQ